MKRRRSEVYLRCAVMAVAAGLGAWSMSSPALAQKRLALVIGNSDYENVAKLANPINDATDIAAKLKSLKFEVVTVPNADHALMRARLFEFTSRVTDKDTALVFYAGHGITVNGESFLLPVDVPKTLRLPDGNDQGGNSLEDHMISFAKVLEPLQAAKLGIVFLDACRTSATKDVLGLQLVSGNTRSIPLMRGAGSVSVKPSRHSAGVFRAYATQLDNVADDGGGRNSPFTRALLRHIGTPGISIQELMIRIRRSVMQETGDKQIPWEEAALKESFSFVSPGAPVTGGPSRAGTAAVRPSGGGGQKASAPAPRSAKSSSGGSLPPGIGVGAGAGL